MYRILILVVAILFAGYGYSITAEDQVALDKFRKYLNTNKEKILAQAKKTYKDTLKRALEGDSEAMLSLSYMGLGPSAPEDVKRTASAWLHLAAENGNVEAQIQLGNAYREGDFMRLISIDLEKAKIYLKRAAESGNTTAIFYYKDLLECGIPGQELDYC